MIANHLYNITLPSDETFLSTGKNIMIIATIFNQAIFKHVDVYGVKDIPLSFFEFYIGEIKNYEYMFRKQTRDFFDEFEQYLPNINLITEIYAKSFFANCKNVVAKGGENYLKVTGTQFTDFYDEMMDSSSKEVSAAISNIKKITEHINNNDEIIPFQNNYEHYMISKIIRQNEFGKKNEGKSRFVVNVYSDNLRPQVISATRRAERLTSERIKLANQQGRITKIIIPKLKLPTPYPKSSTFSRFDSKYRSRNFVSPSRMILILNDLKINGVAYSNNFVSKRKSAIDRNLNNY